MKYSPILIVFLLLQSLYNLNAQNKKVENLRLDDSKTMRFGYYLGINFFNAKNNYFETNNSQTFNLAVKSKPGFDVGLIADFRLNNFFNIRFHPGVAFVEREIKFPFSEEQFSEALINRVVKSNYIRFPLGLKFNTKRIGNFRPFIMGSFSKNINLSSNEKSVEDNTSGTFRMKSNVNGWEFSIGSEIYLPFFKFTPSVHGFFGLTNEILKDNDENSPFTRYIKSMKSRGIFLRFTFE